MNFRRATNEKAQSKRRQISAGYCMAGITLCHAGQTRAALATKTTQRQANTLPQAATSIFATIRLRRYKLEVLTMDNIKTLATVQAKLRQLTDAGLDKLTSDEMAEFNKLYQQQKELMQKCYTLTSIRGVA